MFVVPRFKACGYRSLQFRTYYNRCRIGHRDVVGFGVNGSNVYKDDAHFPFPAIRFRETTRDIEGLRQKEKGHWRLLSCEEKKTLYRASFCNTFAEFQHPTGHWKFCVGWAAIFVGVACWMMIFFHFYIAEPLPISVSEYAQKHQLRRMIELRVNDVDGIMSTWDYEHDCWKWQTEQREANEE